MKTNAPKALSGWIAELPFISQEGREGRKGNNPPLGRGASRPYCKMISKFLALCTFYFALVFVAAANTNYVWHFEDDSTNQYQLSDNTLITVNTNGAGFSELILQAESKYRTSYEEYTTNLASFANGRVGPNASIVLDGVSGAYPASGEYTSRIIDGGSGVVWDMFQFRASDYAYVADPSLVCYYKMDDDNWLDYVTRNYAAPFVGPSFSLESKIGSHSGNFRGPAHGDHLELYGRPVNGLRAMTIACWFKLRNFSDFGGLAWVREGNFNAVGLSQWIYRSGNYLRGIGFGPFEGDGTTLAIAGSVLQTNQWMFAVGTWDADGDGLARLYLDGVLTSTAGTPFTKALSQVDKMKIGWDDWKTDRVTDGLIDEVAIWQRALTSNEVASLHKSYALTSPLRFQVRSGTTTSSISSSDFVGPDGTINSYYADPRSQIYSCPDFNASNQFVQYKAYVFSSIDGTKTPYIEAAGFISGSGETYNDLTLADLDAGSYSSAISSPSSWDTPYLGLSKKLNGGYHSSGSYTSQVFDAGVAADWNSIDWDVPQELPATTHGLVALFRMNNTWGSAVGFASGAPSVNAGFTSVAKLGGASGKFNGTDASVVFNINANVQCIEFWMADDLPADGVMTVNYDTTNSFSLAIENHAMRVSGLEASRYDLYINGLEAPTLSVGWNHICLSLNTGLSVDSISLGIVGSDYMLGKADDLAIYNRAVGSGEAYSHYQNAAGPIGGQVSAQIRYGNTLPLTTEFAGSGADTNNFYGDAEGLFLSGQRFFQYKLYLNGDGNVTPAVRSIAVNTSAGTFVDDTRDEINMGGPVNDTTIWYGDAFRLEQKARFGPVAVSYDPYVEGIWHMDEDVWAGADSVIDSIKGRHGSPGPKAGTGAGAIVGSKCGNFVGADSYVTMKAFALAQDFSVHLWFCSETANKSALISCDDGSGYYTVELNGDGSGTTVEGAVSFILNDGSATRTLVTQRRGLNNGKWHHLVAIRESDQIHLYIDGTRDSSVGIAPFGSTGDGVSLFLGKRGNAADADPDVDYYTGLMDELAIFSRALTEAEVGNLFCGGYRTDVTASYESDPIDNGQPAIWQTLFWATDGTYGNRLYPSGDADLKALWSFEGGSLTNSFGQTLGTSGTVNLSNSGRLGAGIELTGTGHLQLPYSATLDLPAVTVEAWVKMVRTDSRIVMDKLIGTGYRLGTDLAGLPYFQVGGRPAIKGYLPIRIGKWTHVLGWYDGSEIRLYVDGELVALDENAVGANPVSGTQLRIGEALVGGQNYDGYIDEVAIHGRALNAGEILDHYKAGAVTLRFQCRTANSTPMGASDFYRGPGGSSNTYFTVGGGDDMVGDVPLGQYLQFKAYLATEDYRYTPSLNGVKVFVSSYPSAGPYVANTEANGYWFLGDLISFSDDPTLNPNTSTSYQISGDPGSNPTWYYWNGSWSEATLSSHTNSAATINANIGSFYEDLYAKTGGVFRFRQFLNSQGDQQISVDSITLEASEGRIVVTSPNGTENGDDAWISRVPYDITWDWAGNVSANVELLYSENGTNGPWLMITNSVPRGAGGSGSFTWTLPLVTGTNNTNYMVRVRDQVDVTIDDRSDGPFSIVQRFRVTDPNGSEKWYMGSTTNITWESPQGGGTVAKIDFTPDGTNYIELASIAPNLAPSKTNSYPWTIPWNTNFLSGTAKIMVQPSGGGNHPLRDESDLPFELAGVVVQEPIAGRKVKRLADFDVLWMSQGAGTNVEIHLSSDGGSTFTNLVTASTGNQDGTNSYTWTVTQDGTDTAMLRVRSVSDGRVLGYSPVFTLADIDVTAPDGGEIWLMDTVTNITWTSGGAGPTVGIYYSIDSGSTYTQIGGGPVANNGSYAWTVTRNVSQNGRIKIVSEGSGTDSDTNLFSVSANDVNFAGLRVRQPDVSTDTIDMGVASLVLHDGAPQSWGDAGGVKLEVSYDEMNNWSLLGPGAAAYGLGAAFPFTPTYPSTKARIRATFNDASPYTNVFDISDQYFTIAGVLVSQPTNGAVFNIGDTEQVNWASAGAGSPAYIEYSNAGTNSFVNLTPLGVGNNEVYPGANTYNWNVATTLLPSTNARIRVRAGSYSSISDPFTLRGIRITSPTSSTVWNQGTGQAITWSYAGIEQTANVDMWLSTDGGATFPYEIINTYALSTTVYPWSNHPDYDPSTNSIIRMRVINSPTPNDTNVVAYSDPFTLKGIKVRQPVAGTAWELGTTQTVSFIAANAGAQATISYSADGGSTYDPTPVVSGLPIVDGSNSFSWVISESLQPSTNVVLRVAGTDYTGYSEPFTVGGVKVNRPFQYDIWAVGESNVIEWVSVGGDGTNLIELIYLTPDPNYIITNSHVGTSGLNSLNWLVDAGAIPGALDTVTGVVLRVTDTGGYVGASEPFKMVSSPRIEMAAPLAGEFWKVGETKQIQWLKGGQMDPLDFKIFWSHDDFATVAGEVLNAVSFNSSNNLFSVDWTVPDELGATKVLVTNVNNSLVYDYSGEFDICGNFRVIFPNGDPAEPELYSLNQGNVSWGTRGSVNTVDMYYKYGATGTWTKINTTPLANNPGSAGEAISGATWDPLPYSEGSEVYFRVQDSSYATIYDGVTPGPYDDSDAFFPIKWYSIYWDVTYIDDLGFTQRMDKLSVSDSSGWSASDLSSVAAPILRRYPYGVYDTAWYREFFHDQVDFHWVCDSNHTRLVEMRKSEVEPDYHVLSDFSYQISNRVFNVHSWLERSGAILSDPAACTLEIYDNTGGTIYSGTTTSHDPNGVFWQEWDVGASESFPGEFTSADIFFAKVSIEFSGVEYSAGMTFALRLAAGEETVQAVEAIMSTATSNILVGVSAVDSNVTAFRTETGTSLSNIATDVTSILGEVAGIGGMSNAISSITNTIVPQLTGLSNSIAIIEPAVTNLNAQMTNVVEDTAQGLSRILTRPTSVAYGSTNTVLYKSRAGWGGACTYTVSNSVQGQVASGSMTEIIGGIYSADLVCNWGTNSYVVTCRDPRPAQDSMVLTVIGDDPNVVPTLVGSISNQIADLEAQITNLQSTVSGIAGSDLSGVEATLDAMSNTLTQVQTTVGTSAEGVDLSSVISAIEGIEIPEGEELDLSALTRIEQEINNTVLNRIGDVENEVTSVGRNAQSAKTAASDASSGVDELKEALTANDVEKALQAIAGVKGAVDKTQSALDEMEKLRKLGLLYDSIYSMAATIEDLAQREGFKNFLVPVEKAEGEEVLTTEQQIEKLMSNVTEMKGSMTFMTKLIDDMKNEPVVQIELIGE